jgi:hypothetical protein
MDIRPQTEDRRTHLGSCHCGRVTFELDAKLDYAMACNCSTCSRVGAVRYGASGKSLRITAGESELSVYQFHTMTARRYFCRHCGVHPFTRPRLDPSRWAVSVRCLQGVAVSSLARRHFDGENWEEAAKVFHSPPKA